MLNKNKVGLTLGLLMGGLRVVWSFFVAVGWAKPIMDFILGIHSLSNPYEVAEFTLMNAILAIIFASLVAYVVGYAFAAIWNKLK